jgi:peptidyl-prolyl cis-trans isomerase SurA
MLMKNWSKLVFAMTLCVSALALPFSANAQAPTKKLDKVAVIVNNGVILESEIANMMHQVKFSASKARQQLPDDKTLRSQITERLIMDSILLQIAQNQGVQIPDEQLNMAIADIARQNRISVAQLRKYIESDGINFNNYREQFRKDMLLGEVRNNEVRRRVNILPQEVDMLAKQMADHQANQKEFNLSHILIALPENPSQKQIEKVESLANSLVDQLKKGANFGKLAVAYSADGQALNGGAMGWGKQEELPGPFAKAIDNAEKGAIVGPIRSGVGFHILKVNDIRVPQQQKIMATEVHARHILIKPSVVLSDQAAQAKAQALLQDIQSNKITFEQAARKNSEDPGSSQQGGDLGWASPDIYDPAFRNTLLQLKKGQISSPVKSNFGWHIIQLLDSRQIDATDAAFKEQAYRMLFNRKFTEESQVWLQEERAMAYVKIIDNSGS